jgi:phasin family protein
MTKNPFLDNWMKINPANTFTGFGSFPVDLSTIMESGRKTFQALTQAQQVALENMQTIAERQREILSQFVTEQSKLVQDITKQGTPEEKIARSTELMRKAYESSVANSREMVDMLTNSTRKASDILNNRIADSLQEIKKTVQENPVSTHTESDKAA